eukprot:TRINITY_DN2756_c0_g1_i20.p1 TRINITY_DN2756_c0_g1~~TRINITY_DN2756_c0_g1_i20.p1  ORF type:complete len:332 (+),score=49.04 TRINITY_DN2756_c0_g1_i20:645-1640(+)
MDNHIFLVCLCLFLGTNYAVPTAPSYYPDQLVDHFSSSTSTFTQRYYKNDTYFTPNSPIFVIMGGEGAIPPSTGIFYPWVLVLAQRFGALVVEPEHRFYGTSQPYPTYSINDLSLLTPQQALADTARFILWIKEQYKSPESLVLTIGGSYPGFLSAMMRLRYPAVVDFAYAASAPLLFWSGQVSSQYAYYQVVSRSAELSSTGCLADVRDMLTETLESSVDKNDVIKGLNLCLPLPDYLEKGDLELMVDEILMVVMYTFANLNMANYPPPNTTLREACLGIQGLVPTGNSWAALSNFLRQYSTSDTVSPNQCYNLSHQLPAGKGATISGGK